jgi:hypothetical protein
LELDKYPPFFQESDRLAVESQKKQFRLVRIKVVIVVISAVLLSVPWKQVPVLGTISLFIVAVLLVVLIAITVLIQSEGHDTLWIDCRAVAEAIKTETWLFMMKSQPYSETLETKEAEKLFMDRVAMIMRPRPTAASQIAVDMGESPQITAHMKQIRNETIDQRLEYYAKNRIADQKKWYSAKATWNRNREATWFTFAWLLELLAAIAAIAGIILPNMFFDPVQVISAASGGLIMWLNSRSYKEPANSYGMVANDLELQRNYAACVTTEEDLSLLVTKTEEMINREQKIWLARI